MKESPDFTRLLRVARTGDPSTLLLPSGLASFLEFEPKEYLARYAKAIALMEDQGLDALLLTQDQNVRYFSGYRSILWISNFRPIVALMPRDPVMRPTMIVPTQETGNASETTWFTDPYLYPDQDDPIPHLIEAIRRKGLRSARIGAELGFGMRFGMSVHQLDDLREALAPASLVDATPLLQAIRMIKSESELQKIEKACQISQIGTRAGWEALRPGISERELMGVICSAMFAAGAEPSARPSFFGLAAGPNRYKLGANAIPSDNIIRAGDLVIMDGGAVYGGYVTDYIRQACVGHPTDEQQRFFDIAREANDAAIASIRPGALAADVYDAAMQIFETRKVREFSHHTIIGHGTGMDVHEVPWLGERETVYTAKTILEPGMVLCVEPVFVRANDPERRKGTWIQEDVVVVTDDGSRVLTTDVPKSLWISPLHDESADSGSVLGHRPTQVESAQ